MPASPPSCRRRCNSRARCHAASVSRAITGGLFTSIVGMFSASHDRARESNSATDSVVTRTHESPCGTWRVAGLHRHLGDCTTRTGRLYSPSVTATAQKVTADDPVNRKALLDAAERLMLEEGYAAVTTRRVAARAGLKPQLV